MVKYVCVLFVLMAFAAPAFAQDYPQIEIMLGYGNLGLKNYEPITGRHSGFATYQSFNITKIFAIENYVGYYGLGDQIGTKTQLITDTFGGRFNYRTSGPVIYGSAGMGGGWLRFPDFGSGTQNGLAFRYGGGVDFPLGDTLAVKLDVSRQSFHLPDFVTGQTVWKSGMNIATGIVLRISQ